MLYAPEPVFLQQHLRMRLYNNTWKLAISACTLVCLSCTSGKSISQPPTNTDLTQLKFTAEAAEDWTNLFYRKSGWFGADGIFAIQQNGVDTLGAGNNNQTLLLFSDTMFGDIVNDSLQPGFTMVHNSVGIMQGNTAVKDSIRFYINKKEDGSPESMFIPNTPDTRPGDYFWLGDGFVNTAKNDATYVFGYRVRDTSTAAFGFAEVGNVLIKIPKGSQPPFADQEQMDTPFFLGGTPETYGSFGACIFPNTKAAGYKTADGYVYVYGVRGKAKNVIVARVQPQHFEDFDQWRYWDGAAWNKDITKVANITDRASNELSVCPLPDGRYAMVFQTDGIGHTVGLRLSNHPQGPFGPIINLWECKEPNMAKNFIVYNAKAHTNLSKPNELLVSYNVNSFDFWNDVKVYPNLYRPRFITVKLLQ